MTRIYLILAMGLTTVLSLASSKELGAQIESQACISSARTVVDGTLSDAQAQILSRCRHSGPDALARMWLRPNTTPKTLELLLEASAMLRDTRLLKATLASLQNESLPITTRLAAMRVLASYYSAELSPSTSYLLSGIRGDPIPVVIGRDVQDGTSPLQSGSRREIQLTLLRLSSGDPRNDISRAALMLRQGLAFIDPLNTPLSEKVVRLSAGCGPRVSLESKADIDLDLRVRVLETDYDQHFLIHGAQQGRSGKLSLALPVGIVVVNFGSKELARLSDRRAPCREGLTRQ